jgi:hypothetical protein
VGGNLLSASLDFDLWLWPKQFTILCSHEVGWQFKGDYFVQANWCKYFRLRDFNKLSADVASVYKPEVAVSFRRMLLVCAGQKLQLVSPCCQFGSMPIIIRGSPNTTTLCFKLSWASCRVIREGSMWPESLFVNTGVSTFVLHVTPGRATLSAPFQPNLPLAICAKVATRKSPEMVGNPRGPTNRFKQWVGKIEKQVRGLIVQ